MTVNPSKSMISRISGAMLKSIVWGDWIQIHPYSKPHWISRMECQSWCWAWQWFYRPVLCRRDYSLLVIGDSHYIERINIVEHDLIGSEQDSDGSDGWILIFVRVGPFESTIGKWTLDEYGVMHFPLIPKRYIRANKRLEMVLEPLIFRWQSISCLILNEG